MIFMSTFYFTGQTDSAGYEILNPPPVAGSYMFFYHEIKTKVALDFDINKN